MSIQPFNYGSPPEGFSAYPRRRGWLLGAVLFLCWIFCWVVTVSVLLGWWCTDVWWFSSGQILLFSLLGSMVFKLRLLPPRRWAARGCFLVSSPRNSGIVIDGSGLFVLAFSAMVALVTTVFVFVFCFHLVLGSSGRVWFCFDLSDSVC